MTAITLNRTALGIDRAPVRMVHIGLGHFFRAHQAWYTAHSTDAQEWGIAAFAGRGVTVADALADQDGLFALVERGADSDRVEIVASVVETAAGTNVARLVELVADPSVAVITLTVTESGYRLLPDGRADLSDPELSADLRHLMSGGTSPRTVIARLTLALDARRQSGAGPIAIVPCDNIPDNAHFVGTGVADIARRIDPRLEEWVSNNVSFVSTSVDRITPHVGGAPETVAAAGWIDAATVVTEPFTDWVLSGAFPAGRPDWESAGARFVDDIEPWENRKLWLLNGAHSILAFAGMPRGLQTVAEAIADPDCRELVLGFWAEAVQCLPEEIEHEKYRAQLLDRFKNPRIVHGLAQIAAESTIKVQFRLAAVAERTLAAGRDTTASENAVAAWIHWVREGFRAPDSRASAVSEAVAALDPFHELIALVSPTLARSEPFVDHVFWRSVDPFRQTPRSTL